MERMHYTLSQVDKLTPNFRTMLVNVITDVLSFKDPTLINYRKTYMVDGQPFEFIVKASVMRELSTASRQAATAVTFIHGHPYTINFEKDDFNKSLEDALPEALMDKMEISFISTIQSQMAKAWYFSTYEPRIEAYAKEHNFEAIMDLIEYPLTLNYDEFGYEVGIYNQESTGPQYLVYDKHFSMYNDGLLVPKKYDEIFIRYLNSGLLLLIAAGLIFKDQWSNTLN